jgi:hypothetical protein
MKNILLTGFLLLTLLSCTQTGVDPESSETESARMAAAGACGVEDPLRELEWLKTNREQTAKALAGTGCTLGAAFQGLYGGKTVFILYTNGGAACDVCMGGAVFDCEGNYLFGCDPNEEAKITGKKELK